VAGFWKTLGQIIGITPKDTVPVPPTPPVQQPGGTPVRDQPAVPVPPPVAPPPPPPPVANTHEANDNGVNLVVLYDLIKRSEGTARKGDPYNCVIGYGKWWPKKGYNKPLTQMTIREVKALGREMVRLGAPSSAVGAYQILTTKTLPELQERYRITDDQLFTAKLQDRLCAALLERRGFSKWRAGAISTKSYITNLSKEWASLPGLNGESYYKQHVGVTLNELVAALGQV